MENNEIVAILEQSRDANLSLVEANNRLQSVIDSLLPKAQAYEELYEHAGTLTMKDVSDRLPTLPNGMTNSNQKIIRMLLDIGDIKRGYYGYETNAQGRSRGLLTADKIDGMGHKHTSVIATQDGLAYISRAIKRYYGA